MDGVPFGKSALFVRGYSWDAVPSVEALVEHFTCKFSNFDPNLTADKILSSHDWAISRFYCHKADLSISISESIRKRKTVLDPANVYSYTYFGPFFETVVRKRFVSFLDFLALQKRICIFYFQPTTFLSCPFARLSMSLVSILINHGKLITYYSNRLNSYRTQHLFRFPCMFTIFRVGLFQAG